MVLKSEALKQSIKDGFHTPDVEQCETPLNGPSWAGLVGWAKWPTVATEI